MTYNSKHTYERIIDSKHLAKPAQVGVDLTVKNIQKILRPIKGIVTIDENSKLQNAVYGDCEQDDEYFYLGTNSAYAITFDQGLHPLKENEYATVTVRSSLNRIGVRVEGAIFDPGYGIDEESGMGTTIYTWDIPIRIHKHARVCQFQIHENEPADLYSGRWQGTNQV